MKKCYICNNEFESFNPNGKSEGIFLQYHVIGGGHRDNCYCPSCQCMDRERWLYFVLKNYTNIFVGKGNVLHFAPEYYISRFISDNKSIDYYSCDIEPGRAMHIVDITNIQFKNNFFDFIIFNHVMEHIKDEKKAIKEIKRVLKKDGKCIFSFPICFDNKTFEDKKIETSEDRLKYYGQEDHVRLYGNDFAKRFEKYGLKLNIYSPKDILDKDKIEKYGFIEDDVIIIATKK